MIKKVKWTTAKTNKRPFAFLRPPSPPVGGGGGCLLP